MAIGVFAYLQREPFLCHNLCAVSKFSVNSHRISMSLEAKEIREQIATIIRM